MLTDVKHRVLRTETVLDVMYVVHDLSFTDVRVITSFLLRRGRLRNGMWLALELLHRRKSNC